MAELLAMDQSDGMTGGDEDAIIDYAERARIGDWTLRSALVRYAQPEPARASAVLELIRRTDGALKTHARAIEQQPELNATARHRRATGEPEPTTAGAGDMVVDLLVVALELDHLADVLTAWATDIDQPRPDPEVDVVARRVFGRLSDLGVERETRPARRT